MLETAVKPEVKKAHSVKAAAASFDASVPFVRSEIRKGRLRAKHVGGKVVILDADLQNYLENQPDWKPASQKQETN
jgi:hypothetical protein